MIREAESSRQMSLADLTQHADHLGGQFETTRGIGEVKPRQVRYFIQEGLLPPPATRGRGASYPAALAWNILFIRVLQSHGLSVRDIATAVKDVPDETMRRVVRGEEQLSITSDLSPAEISERIATGEQVVRLGAAEDADTGIPWKSLVENELVRVDVNARLPYETRRLIRQAASLIQAIAADGSGAAKKSGPAKKPRGLVVEYTLEWSDGIPVLETTDGMKLVLDTGSPASFCRTERIELAGRTTKVGSEYLGLSAEFLSNLLDAPVDGLVGADLLSRYCVELRLPEAKVVFRSKAPLRKRSDAIADWIKGIPVHACSIDGQSRRCFVDTGAKHSYLLGKHLRDKRPAGTRDDFHAMIGEFRSDTYAVTIALTDGESIGSEIAMLPSDLETLLTAAGVDGIIGMDLMVDRNVTIAYPGQFLRFGQPASSGR